MAEEKRVATKNSGVKTFENAHMVMEIKDGILFGTYKPDAELDWEAADQLIRDRKAFTQNCDYPCLIDATLIKSVDKPARDHLGSPIGTEFIVASAIFTGSIVQTYMANFMYAVNFIKSDIPVRLFTDKQKALDWLQQFK